LLYPHLAPPRRSSASSSKLDKSVEEKTIVEETAKRIETFVQKRVRTGILSYRGLVIASIPRFSVVLAAPALCSEARAHWDFLLLAYADLS
jgi:hypothetical protein